MAALLIVLAIASSGLADQRQTIFNEREPLTIELVNQPGDVPGVWGAKIRRRATEALTRNAKRVGCS